MFRSYSDAIRSPVPTVVDTSQSTNSCDLCDDGGWSSQADVEIHRKKSCLRCKDSKQDLIAHIKTEHLFTAADSQRVERQIFICDMCENVFFNKHMIIVHLKRGMENNCKRYRGHSSYQVECPQCLKRVRIRSVWFHFLYHGLFNCSSCPICCVSFSESSLMMEHIRTHAGYYKCNMCNQEITKRGFFMKHVASHRKETRRAAESTLSDKTIETYFIPRKPVAYQARLRNTTLIKGLSLSPPVTICILCREICLSNEERKRHIEEDHVPEQEKRNSHQCECGEEFFNAVMLKHHVFERKCSRFSGLRCNVTRREAEAVTPAPSSITNLHSTAESDESEVELLEQDAEEYYVFLGTRKSKELGEIELEADDNEMQTSVVETNPASS